MMKTKRTRFLCLLSVLAVSFGVSVLPVQAQDNHVTLSGQIIDVTTGEPLEVVNVFLDHTTKGDVSDKNGKYEISNVAQGTYTLVASLMGYQVEKQTIEIVSEDIVHNFRLKPRTFQFQPLEVSAENPTHWKNDLGKFKKWFIGTSEFAQECEILNPQYLDFGGGSKGSFFARAEAPLEIQNRALGYKIRFILDAFGVHNGELTYSGETQFIELAPKDEAEELRWKNNRKLAYLGSLRHFLSSVIKDEDENEGFLIYMPIKNDDIQKRTLRASIGTPIKVEPGELSYERVLSFQGQLKIEYTKEPAEDGYTDSNDQVSWIELRDSSVVVDTSGNLLYRNAIKQYGYWAWKRVGDLLPRDYIKGSSPPLASIVTTPAIDTLSQLIQGDSYTEVEGDLIVAALDELALKDYEHGAIINQLHKDIADIISEREKENWSPLNTNKQRAEFLRKFWLIRDRSLNTRKNERLDEHYERLRIAKSVYSALTPAGYDDRGRIYLKYGEPDAKQIDVSPLYKMVSDSGVSLASGRTLETWSYQRFGRQITFNFVDRISEFQLVKTADDLLPAHLSNLERVTIVSEVLLRRLDIDAKFGAAYAKLSTIDMADLNRAALDIGGVFNEMLYEQSAEQAQIPAIISDQFDRVDILDFSIQPAWFKNDLSDHTLSLAYGIRRKDIKPSKSNAEKPQELLIQSVVRNFDFHDLATYEKKLPVDSSRFDEHGELILQTQMPISQSQFYILADISNPQGHQRGLADYLVKVPAYVDDHLHLSTVIFAKDIVAAESISKPDSTTALIRNDLAIKMYPFSEVRASEPIFLYFEIYGLDMGVSGKTNYEVEYTIEPVKKGGLLGLIGKLNPFGRDKGRVSVSTSQEGASRDDFVFTKLDFSQLSPGEQLLTVKIKDNVANKSREQKSQFVLM